MRDPPSEVPITNGTSDDAALVCEVLELVVVVDTIELVEAAAVVPFEEEAVDDSEVVELCCEPATVVVVAVKLEFGTTVPVEVDEVTTLMVPFEDELAVVVITVDVEF